MCGVYVDSLWLFLDCRKEYVGYIVARDQYGNVRKNSVDEFDVGMYEGVVRGRREGERD